MLAPGDRVERWVVQALLGEGGMASVYLVRHAQLGTLHALKLLTLRSPRLDARFLQEGRVQARLSHPNLVPVRDVLELPQGPALLMDHVRGPALDAVLDDGPLAPHDALDVFRRVLHGVAYAHGQGLVHRDLKPANVLIAVDDVGAQPRVADFGLAKILDPTSDHWRRSRKKTRTGLAMGTPVYMAPEQVRDASRVDARADLYSLGCMLYELLSGRRPYEADDLAELVRQHDAGPPAPIRGLVPEAPEVVVQLLDRLLARDPDARVGSCGEVLALLGDTDAPGAPLPALSGVFADRARARTPALPAEVPATAPPATPAPEVPGRRVPWLGLAIGGGVGVMALAALVLVLVVLWGPGESPRPSPVPPPAPRPVPEVAPPPAPVVPAAVPAPPVQRPPPATVARPAPARPAPAPVPDPAPEPDPVPVVPPAVGAALSIRGDADSVWLARGDARFRDGGRLSPGTYAVHAVFAGAAPREVLQVTVTDDAPLTIRCAATLEVCAVE